MKRILKLLHGCLLPIAFCLPICVFAQPGTDEQLATQYLQNKEYDKAVVYFEKLFSKKKDEAVFYNPYLLCLTKLKQTDKAEKVIKKMIKQYPADLGYIVDLGTLYKDNGEQEKGNSEYEHAIKQMGFTRQQAADLQYGTVQRQVMELAGAFSEIQEWDYAIETYRKGKKLLNGFYPFAVEIAEVYSRKGDIQGMVLEYLSLLETSDDQLQAVQNGLQPAFGEDKDEKKNEIIRTELLKKVQTYPEKIVYVRLLVWYFIQEKNFNAAYVQSKALDKRMMENKKRTQGKEWTMADEEARNYQEGDYLMSLGQLCLSNEDYETAAKCFQYVIERGKQTYNYINARMELLNALYKKVTTQFNYTQTDLQDLEKNFTITLDELGRSSGTAILMKNLAHLQAFFLNKTREAVSLLNEAIALPGINEQTQAECKLELGDIFLMTGEVWDASLLYSQVDVAFKHEPIGNEAKFRNAKLSYYNGEFQWAQAQLDVLKGSTEKLISNDAMDLSILISDNSHEGHDDSLALCMFARADLLSFRNQNDKALLTLDSIVQKYPSTPLADDILYKKYKLKMKEGKFTEAAEQLQKLIDNYAFDILGDDATFKLAELNELYLNNSEKAKQLYEELLTKHPGSLYTVEARKRFRRLRGDTVN